MQSLSIQFHGYQARDIKFPCTDETNPFESADTDAANAAMSDALNSDADCNGWHHGECDGEDFQICDPNAWNLNDEEVARIESIESR